MPLIFMKLIVLREKQIKDANSNNFMDKPRERFDSVVVM